MSTSIQRKQLSTLRDVITSEAAQLYELIQLRTSDAIWLEKNVNLTLMRWTTFHFSLQWGTYKTSHFLGVCGFLVILVRRTPCAVLVKLLERTMMWWGAPHPLVCDLIERIVPLNIL